MFHHEKVKALQIGERAKNLGLANKTQHHKSDRAGGSEA